MSDHDSIVVVASPARAVVVQGGGGVAGTGAAGQLAVWQGPGVLEGDAALAWDAANAELDVTGPGTNNATVYAQATGSGGWALEGEAVAPARQGVYGVADAANGYGVSGVSAAGRGVQGQTTTGIAGYLLVGNAAGTGLVVDQPTAASAPALVAKINNVATVALSPAGAGGAYFNSAALATTATVGYLGIPSCAGIPTGVPAGYPAGVVPLVYDSANDKLYVYRAGAWVASGVFT